MATLRVQGINEVGANLRALTTRLPARAAQALNAVSEETMTDAKERTPVEFGTLRRSGMVADHATARALQARLTFGTDYAVFVHENLNARHRVGEAKFLERAVQATARDFARRIGEEMAL